MTDIPNELDLRLLSNDPRRVLRALIEIHGVPEILGLTEVIGDSFEPTDQIKWTEPKECSDRYRGEPGGYQIEYFSHADDMQYEISKPLPDGTMLILGQARSLYEAKSIAAEDAGLDV